MVLAQSHSSGALCPQESISTVFGYEHGSDGEGNISAVLLMEVACHYQYFLLFRDSGHCQFSLFLLLSFQFQVRVGMCYLKSTVWVAGGVTHKQV